MGVDLHALTRRADGAGGTGVETARAPADAGCAVRADVRVVAEVAGLLELAHEIRRLIERCRERRLVAAGREVARREDLVRDGRFRPQIDHDVERLVPGQGRRGDDDRRSVTPGAEREGAEMSVHLDNVGANDARGAPVSRVVAGRRDDHGIERVPDSRGHRRRLGHRADEGEAPGRDVADETSRSDGRVARFRECAGARRAVHRRRREAASGRAVPGIHVAHPPRCPA